MLTYNLPKGEYGEEPIMLDFYLTNAPLHLVAQENPDDNIVDWRIRVTVNGSSFVVDRWEPIYLKGFEPGPNWIKLEFLDEQGNSVNNVFNNTARLLTYKPRGQDSLAKLIRGELSSDELRSLVNPNDESPIEETVTPEVEVTPEEIPEDIPEFVPLEPIADQESPDRVLDDEKAIEEVIPQESPVVEVTPEEIPEEIPEFVPSEPISAPVSEEEIDEVSLSAENEETPPGEIQEAIEQLIPEETPPGEIQEAIEQLIPEETPPGEIQEAIEQLIPEETPPGEIQEAIELLIPEESGLVEVVTPEETAEKTVPEETEPVLPVTTSQPDVTPAMTEIMAPVETPEAVTTLEATTSTTETIEDTESAKVNIREVADRLRDRVFDFVNGVGDFVKDININDVKVPWFGGEASDPTPAAVD